LRAAVASSARNWKRLLGRAKEHSVGVRRRFVGQRRHVQPAHRDEGPPGPVVVRNAIGTIGVRDIALNQDEIRPVVELEALHVFVHENRLIVWRQERRQRGQPQRWKQ
jgi:hypothetical protein